MSQRLTLHPAIRPALAAGRYELRTSQVVSGSQLGTKTAESRTQHLDVVAPQTTMAPNEVFGVFPPPNAQGPFEARLPHITLRRRTLPWDRSSPPTSGPPWLILVMLAEGEGTLLRDLPASECYSAGVAATLTGLDPDVRGDCIQVSKTVLDRTFPARDEIDLLCHVRQADASDTELADDDHFVSVVLGNRLPQAGTAYRCLLLSVEGQHASLPPTGGSVNTPTRFEAWEGIFDLAEIPIVEREVGNGFTVVGATIGSTRSPFTAGKVTGGTVDGGTAVPRAGRGSRSARGPAGVRVGAAGAAASGPASRASFASASIGADSGFVRLDVDPVALEAQLNDLGIFEPTFRFPVLASWEFECSGAGDFAGYMQRLHVALFADPGASAPDPRAPVPVTTATGHLQLTHTDRRGDTAPSWYRGPAVPVKITREPAGAPYHVADQARRIGPEGREDLSLASAFEVGRLLAMSDPQFLAALRRWARAEFALARDSTLVADLGDLLPTIDGVAELGRHLLIGTLLPGGIGGDPRVALGNPLPRHTDALLAQPADVEVLAAGLRVAKGTITQLLGPGLSDQSIAVDVVDTGPVSVDEALGALGGLRQVLDQGVATRIEQVAHLDELVERGEDLGLLGKLVEGP